MIRVYGWCYSLNLYVGIIRTVSYSIEAMPQWRNRLARQSPDQKVGGSIPDRGIVGIPLGLCPRGKEWWDGFCLKKQHKT